MKIEMLNVGWISASAAVWRKGDDPDRQSRIPVPSYVIETGDERILIDTGLHPAGVDDPKAFNQSGHGGYPLGRAAVV